MLFEDRSIACWPEFDWPWILHVTGGGSRYFRSSEVLETVGHACRAAAAKLC